MTTSQAVLTTVIVTLLAAGGLAAAVAGAVSLARALPLRRRCTATARGTVVDVVAEGDGPLAEARARRREARDRREDQAVTAVNEQVAAKQRSWRAKQRAEARDQLEREAARWHAVVQWSGPDGEDRRTRGRRAYRRDALRTGLAAQVSYDPADPSVSYVSQEGSPAAPGLTLVACGAALVGVALLCWILLPWVASQGM